MPTSIRQQIFDAVKVRFSNIMTVNGYLTNIGSHCFSWRDLEKHPFAGEAELSGSINITDQDKDPGDGVLTAHDQILNFEVTAVGTGAPPDNQARRIEADILTAIGTDIYWTVSGTKLAKDTIQGRSTIGVGHFGERVAWVRINFQILFRTQRFSPFTI